MKKNILSICSFLICFVLVAAAALGIILFVLPDPFDQSYQRALVRQYDYNQKIDGNKIVFVGNSSLSFGLDLDLMEQLTGKTCSIIGNHMGYGLTVPLNMAKSNLKKGDTLIIEYANNGVGYIGESLLLSGIGNRFDLYQFIPEEKMGSILKYYRKYLTQRIFYNIPGLLQEDAQYSLKSYDARGNMILPRETCLLPEPYNEEAAKNYNWADFNAQDINMDFIAYLNEYAQECRQMGVDVYFILPYYLDEAVRSNEQEILQYEQTLRENLQEPLISHLSNHFYPRKYIYNAIEHCNTEGAKHHTQQLYQELSQAGAL